MKKKESSMKNFLTLLFVLALGVIGYYGYEYFVDGEKPPVHLKPKTEYFTVNGETDDGDIYGGVYLNGNTVIIVYTQSTRGADTKKVDEILEALDLPTP